MKKHEDNETESTHWNDSGWQEEQYELSCSDMSQRKGPLSTDYFPA